MDLQMEHNLGRKNEKKIQFEDFYLSGNPEEITWW
jgi:hypothetical protein